MNILNETIAIVGGGPAALLIFKRLIEGKRSSLKITIFEAGDSLGRGMPYSELGSRVEHVTNVSSDELPTLATPLVDWIKALSPEELKKFGIERDDFHEKEVISRLLFGEYLKAQFDILLKQSATLGLGTTVRLNTPVIDLVSGSDGTTIVVTKEGNREKFDRVVVCTGHHWLKTYEGKVPGYFDSPYPPSKLVGHFNHKVTVRGSSLTAVDALKTIALHNGSFRWEGKKYVYKPNENSPKFRIAMHSKHGLLPCIRVHYEEPHSASNSVIAQEELDENMRSNDGFLQLDFVFERGFKEQLKESDRKFYDSIANMNLETFVDTMMNARESLDPFTLFKMEYEEAHKSIAKERPVHWKELLSAVSFALNFPAKHLSAEDMLRLQKNLMPLISVVIAFLPQSSCETLMALHDADILSLIADGEGSTVEVDDDGKILYTYSDDNGKPQTEICETFVDCIGQKHLQFEDFPFKGLFEDGSISGARLMFRSPEAGRIAKQDKSLKVDQEDGKFFLRVPGVNITDNFEVVDAHGNPNPNLFLMAVPLIGGYNPDYSGLDFCERSSELIAERIFNSKSVEATR